MSKIVIFGSTGNTGLCAVDAAVKKGLKVRAFVRTLSKLPEHLKSKVEVFKGDVLEPDSVNDAIQGMEAVVVVLGTNNCLEPTTDMSEGLKNIIEGMRQARVKTVSVCLSSFLFFDKEKIPTKFLNVHEDHVRMYDAIKASGLNYVAVCAPHIDEGPSKDIRVFIETNEGAARTITKWDLGKFLVDSVTEPKYYGKRVLVCNMPKQ